jgi:eukaryotic-like serine/threonine-protein kinase
MSPTTDPMAGCSGNDAGAGHDRPLPLSPNASAPIAAGPTDGEPTTRPHVEATRRAPSRATRAVEPFADAEPTRCDLAERSTEATRVNRSSVDPTLRPGERSPVSSASIAATRPTSAREGNVSRPATDPRELPVGRSRYELGSELARGGCGVVQRATDRQLRREVVVKRLLPELDGNQELRRRFWHEALITGGLEHPGIAPVYEAGIDERTGEPFYAMKRLEGETFAKAIVALHRETEPRRFVARRRELLDRFVRVCQTLAYAHERQVIHRDIKPANVMLGRYGETVILDWGIAKRIGEHDSFAATPGDESTGEDSEESRSNYEPTRCGALIGTPSAMSPEQAAGAVDSLDHRSDLFSLGTLLYELLTGVNPFRGATADETLERVRRAEPLPCRRRDRRIPRPLAAICARSLALSPDDRYADAEALADDVRRFLAGERVVAHDEAWWERTDRWVRHHRAIAWTVLLAVTVVATLASIATLVVRAAHRAEQIAHADERQARADEARAHAESLRQLTAAREAADTWLISVSGDLQHYPGLEPLRRELFDRARDHYRQLARESSGDPNRRGELARLLIRLGDLERLAEDRAASASALRNAIEILETECRTSSSALAGHEVRLQLANAWLGLALLDTETGSTAESAASTSVDSRQALQQVDAILNELPADAASVPIDNLRVRAAITAARQLVSEGEFAAAAARLAAVREMSIGLVETTDEGRYRHLAHVLLDEGATIDERRGELAGAIEQLELADELSSRVIRHTERPDLLETRGLGRIRLGNLLLRTGRAAEAEVRFAEAIGDLDRAWQTLYGDPFFSENLAIAMLDLGKARIASGKPSEAESALREGLDLLREVVATGGASIGRIERTAAGLTMLADLLESQGDPEAAELRARIEVLREHLNQIETGKDR